MRWIRFSSSKHRQVSVESSVSTDVFGSLMAQDNDDICNVCLHSIVASSYVDFHVSYATFASS